MTDSRTLNISTDGLATINDAFVWIMEQLDTNGLEHPSIEIEAYQSEDDGFEATRYSASVWGSV